MRRLMLATTCAIALLATGATFRADAADLPATFLGSWTNNDGAGQFEVTGIYVGPKTYHEPGYNCDIKSVTAKNEAGAIGRGRVYIVDMVCMGDGEDPGPAEKSREPWALRKINGDEMLVMAGIAGATYPSILVLQRPIRAKKLTSFTLACHIAYGSPPPTLAADVEQQIGSVCHQYTTLAKCEEAKKKLHRYERSVVGGGTWIIETDCKPDQ